MCCFETWLFVGTLFIWFRRVCCYDYFEFVADDLFCVCFAIWIISYACSVYLYLRLVRCACVLYEGFVKWVFILVFFLLLLSSWFICLLNVFLMFCLLFELLDGCGCRFSVGYVCVYVCVCILWICCLRFHNCLSW